LVFTLGGFAIILGETGYLVRLSYDFTVNESLYLAIFTGVSTAIGLSFLYRQGYLNTIHRFKLPPLKSVGEHFEIIKSSLKDLVAILLALVRDSSFIINK
jgi:hypothetical protein